LVLGFCNCDCARITGVLAAFPRSAAVSSSTSRSESKMPHVLELPPLLRLVSLLRLVCDTAALRPEY
jgi:hypothetical protein